jgi:AraC family transcriptional regulator, regulatory protein of adaptative response / methylated-DNA-[protein]-cysteine methyltransferase
VCTAKTHPVKTMRSDSPLVTHRLATPLGRMVAVAADAGLCLLEFADGPRLDEQSRRVGARLGRPIVRGTHAHLDTVEEELHAYFAGEGRAFRVPLLLAGTPFQLAVWRRLRRVPFGCTITYDRLARALGRAGAQRAVGRANGDNPLAIVVPCHRVIGTDGTLTGYGGGLWRKRRLLELEGF